MTSEKLGPVLRNLRSSRAGSRAEAAGHETNSKKGGAVRRCRKQTGVSTSLGTYLRRPRTQATEECVRTKTD